MENQQEQAYDIEKLVAELEKDANLDSVKDKTVEIVVVKTLGTSERLEVKVVTELQHARAATLSVYKEVIAPRSLTHIKETVDYQLEADRLSREIKQRDLDELKEARDKQKKRGK